MYSRAAVIAMANKSVGVSTYDQTQEKQLQSFSAWARRRGRGDRARERSAMARLFVQMSVSLDGFIEDRDGAMDWFAGDEAFD
jgi:hypothetical protein